MTITDEGSRTEGLKLKIVQSGTAKLVGQAVNFVLRLAFLMIMARLLTPEEFGLVAMVTVVTSFYALFTSAGLSSATIQRASVTQTQISTLFWINMLIGSVLFALCLVSAPALVAFYGDPRLLWVTAALAIGFLVNAAGVQHNAILQRELRYVTLTAIEVLAQVATMAAGVALALAGYGYWALVASSLVGPAVMTVLSWVTTGWIPGAPTRDREIRSMLHFGGVVTVQSVLANVAENIDKVLLGRFQGAVALGSYGRAYQLVTMPMTNLNAAVGWVAFSALSRIQDDATRYRSYFLKGYTVVISLVVPLLVFATVFADDIVRVVLGPQWMEVAHIFRLLAPAGLVVTLIQGPTYWLLHSLGSVGRSLRITCVYTLVIVVSCSVGVSGGANGVAAGYSIGLTLWLVPHLIWCVKGTPVSLADLLRALRVPLLGGLAASGVAWLAVRGLGQPLSRVVVGGLILGCGYAAIITALPRQRHFYLGLTRDLRLVRRAAI
jgi:O-antigen/teichoic acid export membrane protein